MIYLYRFYSIKSFILGLQVWQELSIKEKTAARKMVLANIRKQVKEVRMS